MKDSLSYLQETLKYLGFGETLPFNNELMEEVEKDKDAFELTTEAYFEDTSRIEATIFFRKAGKDNMYFVIKYVAGIYYSDKPELNKVHTFHIYKGSGVTLKEAFNLLQGRAVNKDLIGDDGQKYNAWVQLDFSEKTSMDNYKMRQYRGAYSYDLEKVLMGYPIRELRDEVLRKVLIRSLKKGNQHTVTLDKPHGKIETKLVEACPQTRSLTILPVSVQDVQQPMGSRNMRKRKTKVVVADGVPADEKEELPEDATS